MAEIERESRSLGGRADCDAEQRHRTGKKDQHKQETAQDEAEVRISSKIVDRNSHATARHL